MRQVREYLHPNSEHVIDWFHITMRLTVLQQQTKAVKEERPETGAAASKQVESIKHLLWHGNVEEALERLANLLTWLIVDSTKAVLIVSPADIAHRSSGWISDPYCSH